MAPNKTDAHDADGLAQLAEVGFFREVRVKGFDSMLGRTLVAARNRLGQITTELSKQIRGLMKAFGLVAPAGTGSRFEANVRALLPDQEGLAPILLPLLEAWRAVRLRAAELGRHLVASARRSEACQILMSVPGVGAVTATSFATAVEDPETVRRSRSVGAWLGLTTRRYQSGEVDDDGPISRRGDTHLRGLLYEAATVILTRTSAESSLRTWGLKVRIRSGPPCRAWVRVRSIRVCWIDLDRAHVWTQSFRAYGGGQYAPVLGGLGEARHCRRGAADHEFDLFGGAPARDHPEPSVSVAARTSAAGAVRRTPARSGLCPACAAFSR